jgi:hypothetical protein
VSQFVCVSLSSVVKQGSHRQLIASRGAYYRFLDISFALTESNSSHRPVSSRPQDGAKRGGSPVVKRPSPTASPPLSDINGRKRNSSARRTADSRLPVLSLGQMSANDDARAVPYALLQL